MKTAFQFIGVIALVFLIEACKGGIYLVFLIAWNSIANLF